MEKIKEFRLENTKTRSAMTTFKAATIEQAFCMTQDYISIHSCGLSKIDDKTWQITSPIADIFLQLIDINYILVSISCKNITSPIADIFLQLIDTSI